jgi:hypothetical protein
MIGASPVVRLRYGSARRVLFYESDQHTPPIRKHKLAFEDNEGDQGIIEFLANGQQVVAEGPHAKGEMHYWRDDVGLLEGKDKLAGNLITGKQVGACFERLEAWVVEEGGKKVKLNLQTSSDNAAAVSITSLFSPHRATDDDLLKRAIEHIDLDHEEMDYDAFINLLRAIAAACGRSIEFFTEVVWPWACTQKVARGLGPRTEEQGIEWLEMRWRSFTDSQLGVEYVYRWAAVCGFSEGATQLVAEMFANDPASTTQDGGDDASGPTAPAQSGPTPFPFTDKPP